MSNALPIRCHCRRHAATSLRCSRCSVPICPDCSIVVPVGQICRECSRGTASPLFKVSVGSFALALPACLAASTLGGWILTREVRGFGFIGLWVALIYGIGIGEIALRITGRKRGLTMELLAGGTTAAGWLLGSWLARGPSWFILFHSPFTYVTVGIAIFASIARIRNI